MLREMNFMLIHYIKNKIDTSFFMISIENVWLSRSFYIHFLNSI